MALAWGKQLLSRLHSVEKGTGLIPEESRMGFSVEVDIPTQAVGKLAGTSRKDQLKKETGADMHLYTRTNKDEYPFVRLRGSADQVESAFESVCDDVATVDIRFARRMQARSTLVAESRQVGWIRGTNSVKLMKIEEDTNAEIRVEHMSREDRTPQEIIIIGTVTEVCAAYEKIKESLESYDSEEAMEETQVKSNKKKEKKTDRSQKQPPADALENERKKKDPLKLSPSLEKLPAAYSKKLAASDSKAAGERAQAITESSAGHIQCKITIEARSLLFACLLGKSQENITKIRESTAADIEIGPRDPHKEFQDIHIEGAVFDVVKATRTVKASLEWFDPNHPISKQKLEKASLDAEEVKRMTGHASLILLQDMAGYYAGKKFANINRIRDETKVDQLSFADHDDNQYKRVEIVGDLECVLEAVDRSFAWLNRFRPGTARSTQQQPSLTKNALDRGQPAHSNDQTPKKNKGKKKVKQPKASQQQPAPSQTTTSRVTHSVEVTTVSSESSNAAQATHQQPSVQAPQPQQLHVQAPQPQQLHVQVPGQQLLQPSNAVPSYVTLQPVSASGQQQIPLQQGHVLQVVPNAMQHPQQLLPQAAQVQVIPGVPGQTVVLNQQPSNQPQVAYLYAAPVPVQASPSPAPQIDISIKTQQNGVPHINQ